jgi:hypothetical protein
MREEIIKIHCEEYHTVKYKDSSPIDYREQPIMKLVGGMTIPLKLKILQKNTALVLYFLLILFIAKMKRYSLIIMVTLYLRSRKIM